MARPTKSGALGVWMNGICVGRWTVSASGAQEFLYDEPWMDLPIARPISLSLPLRPSLKPYRDGVEAFFENLLPDNPQIRERIQRRFQTVSSGAFDLLQEIGRDCVGALQLLPEGIQPPDVRRISGEMLDDAGVAEALAASIGVFGDTTPNEELFRISLAGAQEKTAFLRHQDRWYLPTGATPTTHIFKLPIGSLPMGIDLSTSVENEWLCSRFLKSLGIPVAESQIATFGDYKALIVERFDRRLAEEGTWWMRLPQEDFCQATATPAVFKYENDGGPGIRQIMELLNGSVRALEDRRDFMRRQLAFWLLAAIDGHAKNFSIFLLPGGSYRLTPCYDVLSAHPFLGHGRNMFAPEKIKMAMAVESKSRHYRWKEIRLRHWLETAKRCGVSDMSEIIDEMAERVPEAIGEVESSLPKGFPPAIADSILTGASASLKRLKLV